jgi:hypothetical protein
MRAPLQSKNDRFWEMLWFLCFRFVQAVRQGEFLKNHTPAENNIDREAENRLNELNPPPPWTGEYFFVT